MYGHERSLVQRTQGRPFVLLGVNADESPGRLRQVLLERNLPWRAWWDGPGGPIARQWGVGAFPTVLLLDHRGVIRYRFDGRPTPSELDAAIDGLLNEVPSGFGPTGLTAQPLRRVERSGPSPPVAGAPSR